MSLRILVPAVLACAAVGCSDHAPSLGPAPGGVPALNQGGAPTPVDETAHPDEFLSAVCGFDVQAVNTGKTKALTLPNGRQIFLFPGFDATLTNLTSGTSVRLQLTGSFHLNASPDGSLEVVAVGRNLLGLPPETGVPAALTIGRLVFRFDAAGNPISPFPDATGQIIDVCSLLA